MKTIITKNPDWEETCIYHYDEKKNINSEVQFLEQISTLLQNPLNIDDFIEGKILEEELNLFFEKAHFEKRKILTIKCFVTDWNIKDYLIETEDYYIYKSWETTS